VDENVGTRGPFGAPLFLVNYMPFPGSGWRYMRMISTSLPGPTRTVTVMMGNHPNYRVMNQAGQVGLGLSFRPRAVSTAVNYLAARVVYRSLGRELLHLSDDGGVVHFLQEEINPWVFPTHSVVTIHTNPQALLDTDEYYSVSVQYKLAYRHNLTKYGRFAVPIVESKYVKQGLEEYGFPGSPIVTHPAVEPIFHPRGERGELRRKYGLPPEAKVLLSVSTDERRKNLAILPQVMDLLPQEFVLVRVGSPVRGARTFAALTDEQVAEIYALSDALLFPTLEEGFGYPVIEAFASDTPVVASDLPVMEEVAGKAAILTDPRNAPGLARACRDAVDRRSELVELGKSRVEHFSVSAFVARMEQVYSRAVRS